MRRVAWLTVIVLGTLWSCGSGVPVRACLSLSTVILVNAVHPTDQAAYFNGDLGIVEPTYARRYLVEAYRRFTRSATESDGRAFILTGVASGETALSNWLRARDAVLKTASTPDSLAFQAGREIANHQTIVDCGDDALVTASQTLGERVRRYGASSAFVAEWLRAQDLVFKNCSYAIPKWPATTDRSLTLPAATAASADSLVRADRAYQTAAAYFYAGEHLEAERRFRAIALDRSSPWSPLGRFLAARSLVRYATLTIEPDKLAARDAVLARADVELAAVASDASVPDRIRASAGGLRDFIAIRLQPMSRLHDLGAVLGRRSEIRAQDVIDYTWLFDRLVSEDVAYGYDALKNLGQLTGQDDLTDWIMTLQGTGLGATRRAVDRWKTTRDVHWLVAVLWKIDSTDRLVPDVLQAAAEVESQSPASTTVGFLRARLLAVRGERAQARAVLAALPDRPGPGAPADAVNLVRALRGQLSNSFDEWLQAAPRVPVMAGGTFGEAMPDRALADRPTFDVDAALMFSEQLPLPRFIEAVAADRLPARLRYMVAVAGWTRAVQLRDDAAGLQLAPLIQSLAPVLRQDLARYIDASDADVRHYAGVLTLLRWPSLRNYVPLSEQADDHPAIEPRRTLTDSWPLNNWWCGFGPMRHWTATGPYEEYPLTLLPETVGGNAIGPPAFLTTADRSRAATEFARLAALGTAPNYLATEAVAWAQQRPRDVEIPEALARAVAATRFGCSDGGTGPLSRHAFELLHHVYPASAWTKRTPYWFAGR
jgi:hypothetical protein